MQNALGPGSDDEEEEEVVVGTKIDPKVPEASDAKALKDESTTATLKKQDGASVPAQAVAKGKVDAMDLPSSIEHLKVTKFQSMYNPG